MRSLIFLIICSLAFGCDSGNNPEPEIDDTLKEVVESANPPQNSTAVKMGTFTSFAHSLAGRSVLYVDGSNKRILRLDGFSMTEGPDVYVFLSKSNNYSKANVIELAMLPNGYTNAGLHIEVDTDIDLNSYKFVLVYCVEFSSLFGYTELQ